MEKVSASKAQGGLETLPLPLELRRKIYYFVIIEPSPLPLLQHQDPAGRTDGYGIEKNLRMLKTCKEFRKEMEDFMYSHNCFSISVQERKAEKPTTMFAVDPRRVQKCYILVKDMMGWPERFGRDVQDLDGLIATLAFQGHQIKYLLLECGPQFCQILAEGLSFFSVLRKIRMVQFRSSEALLHPYFRCLEDLMMSDRPIPFSDAFQIRKASRSFNIFQGLDGCWLVDHLGKATTLPVKSEEQMEATAKELYSILGMGRDFIPQNKLDRACSSW